MAEERNFQIASPAEVPETVSQRAVEKPQGTDAGKMEALLRESADCGLLAVRVREIPESRSDAFQEAYQLEKSIIDFQRKNGGKPRAAILCEKDSIAELYKMVYNFYFAVTKDERIMHGRWD